MKPVLVVSACLGFRRCRYDGERMTDPTVESFRGHVKFIPVCPEMGIGLGSPRAPIRVIRGRSRRILYQPAAKRDLTAAMRTYCAAFHASLAEVDGYLLKSRSPSCGPFRVKLYSGFKGPALPSTGAGFFAVAARRFRPGVPIEDEERLKDPSILERFIARIFARARLRIRPKKKRMRVFKPLDRPPRRQY
jgi:uncharacterized protein YbbK (DUF523 family)